MREESNAITK